MAYRYQQKEKLWKMIVTCLVLALTSLEETTNMQKRVVQIRW